jgi:hypothetical protein
MCRLFAMLRDIAGKYVPFLDGIAARLKRCS